MSLSPADLKRVLSWTVEFMHPTQSGGVTVAVPAHDQDQAIAAARGMAAWMGHPWARTALLSKAEPTNILERLHWAGPGDISSVQFLNKWIPQ